jgi:ankyrin repeat protein
MLLSRCVGFASANKGAREGGNLEITVLTKEGARTFLLPWFVVRQVDALLERWRRAEHEVALLTFNLNRTEVTLAEAARAGGARDVAYLLPRTDALIDFNVLDGKSALTLAAGNGHLAVVAMLLEGGAQLLGDATGAAVQGGHLEVVRLLLDRSSHQFAVWRYEALHTAVRHNHPEVARLLVERGAAASSVNLALLRAAGQGRAEMVRLLLDGGADIHTQEDAALCLAVTAGSLEVVGLLLDRGANVHARVNRALLLAARAGSEAMVHLLLERGADIRAGGSMVLFPAVEMRNPRMANLLLERGASARDAIDLAEALGMKNFVERLANPAV